MTGTAPQPEIPQLSGVPLRDYFAAKALQGAAARGWSAKYSLESVAIDCYAMADAMLAEHAKHLQQPGLIATEQELLEALQDIAEGPEHWTAEGMQRIAQEAIAKATGGAA